MAPTFQVTQLYDKKAIALTLLENVQGIYNGEWTDIKMLSSFTVTVSGIMNAKVQLRALNNIEKPLPTNDGVLLVESNMTNPGADPVQKDAVMAIDAPLRWIKAKVTQYTAGTISARLAGVSG